MPTGRSGRRLVLVVGIGRSGTSAFAGMLAALGYAVPQPEVQADPTNPRGFGEPQWVVDFHTELLQRVRVSNFDGRPGAWSLTEQFAAKDRVCNRLRDWLGAQLAERPRLVVKDPRTAWLLPVWERVAAELDVVPSYVTMLRPPPEVLASAKRWYGEGRHEASRFGGWLNVMLHSEAVTRDRPRAFVSYDALLRDWRAEAGRVSAALGLDLDVAGPAAATVDGFLDPGLRREQTGWDDLQLPSSLRAVGERAWAGLLGLTGNNGGTPDVGTLDRLRHDYDRLYAEAELIAQWSIAAARAAGAKAGRKGARGGAARAGESASPSA